MLRQAGRGLRVTDGQAAGRVEKLEVARVDTELDRLYLELEDER